MSAPSPLAVPPPPPPLPPVQPPATPSAFAKAEQDFFQKNLQQSFNIRRLAGYGGLFFCAALYLAGLLAVAIFLGLWPGIPPVDKDRWHIVVAIVVPLFTVPTVLLLAVLRTVTVKPANDEVPASVHEALGQMLSKLFDKLTDAVK